jgi:hypothetical protein
VRHSAGTRHPGESPQRIAHDLTVRRRLPVVDDPVASALIGLACRTRRASARGAALAGRDGAGVGLAALDDQRCAAGLSSPPPPARGR